MGFNFDKLEKDKSYNDTNDIKNMIKTVRSKPINETITKPKINETPLYTGKKASTFEKITLPFSSLLGGATAGLRGLINLPSTIAGTDPTIGNITTFEERVKQIQDQVSSPLKITSEVTGGIGQMVPSIGAAFINPVLGIATGAGTSAGENYRTSIEEGKTKNQARAYGLATGVLEGTLQKALGGINVFGKSGASKLIGKELDDVISKIAKTNTGKEIAKGLASSGSEFSQEYIQSAINPVVRNLTLDENNEFKPVSKEALYSGVLGALTSGVLNSPGISKKIKTGIQTDIQNKQTLKQSQIPLIQPQIQSNQVLSINKQTTQQPLQNALNNDIVQPQVKQTDKVAQLLTSKPKEIKPTIGQEIDKTYQALVNKGAPVDKLAKETGQKELKFAYDKMLGSEGEGQNTIGNFQTNLQGNKIGKSIKEIWEPINESGKTQEFSDYLLHKHNIDRMVQEKPVFGENVTAQDSANIVSNYEKTNPEFIEWSKDINNFNKNELQNMVDAGITSKEIQNYLNETYDNYVRIQREQTKTQGPVGYTQTGVKVNNPIQKAKGGNQNILPLEQSMAEQALKTRNAIRRNLFGKELLKVTGGVKTDTTDVTSPVNEKNGEYTFTVYENGQPVVIPLSKELYDSIKPKVKSGVEDLTAVKAVQGLSRLQRDLITAKNPIFTITNFLKDFQDGIFNSKYPTSFVKNYPKAAYEMLTKSDNWQQYEGLGGSQNTFFDYDTGIVKDKGVIGTLGQWIEKANNFVEQAPRFSEFLSTLEKGKSLNEAMYNAAEVTTNFKRGGDIAKAINRNGVNFFNASIQGFDKFRRNFTELENATDYIKLLSKVAIIGVGPALINDILLSDNEEYKDLDDRTKDGYYLFPQGNGKFIKIPKGRMLSIFGSAARRTLEASKGNEQAFKGFGGFATQQVAPINPFESNLLSPIAQVSTNKSWMGTPIVSQSLQNLYPGMQSDEKTSSLAKKIGESLNISPKKIDYLIKGYTGGIGQVVMPKLTPQAEQGILTNKFQTDSVYSSKTGSDFYDTLDKKNTESANEKIKKNLEKGTTTYTSLESKYLTSKSSEISDLYKQKKAIQNSDITDKEKQEQTRKIQIEINKKEKEALNELKNPDRVDYFKKLPEIENSKTDENKTVLKGKLILDSNYSNKNKIEFMDEMLSDEQKKEVNILGNKLNIPILDSYRVISTIKNASGDKDNADKTISGSSTAKQVLGVLNMNLDNNKKNEILDYLTDSKEPIKIEQIDNIKKDEQTLTNYFSLSKEAQNKVSNNKLLGIDENESIDYFKKISDIKSDKDINGKTITNSKKNKVKKLIGSLNLSVPQKIILEKQSGYDNKSNYGTIYNYIGKLNISNTEKNKILKDMDIIK